MSGLHEDYERLFHEEYRPLLRTVFLICHDHHRAEDIVQDAFLQLFKHWDKVQHLDRPGAWVRRVAIRLAVRSLRREAARRKAEISSVPPWVDHGQDTEILKAIGTLPPRQRAAVVLFYFEDRRTTEIAEFLGCSAATARVHLHRGRRHLAEVLEGAEVIDHASE
jgi:RNA polymerase sigma-70 factor (sigma-E family)